MFFFSYRHVLIHFHAEGSSHLSLQLSWSLNANSAAIVGAQLVHLHQGVMFRDTSSILRPLFRTHHLWSVGRQFRLELNTMTRSSRNSPIIALLLHLLADIPPLSLGEKTFEITQASNFLRTSKHVQHHEPVLV